MATSAARLSGLTVSSSIRSSLVDRSSLRIALIVLTLFMALLYVLQMSITSTKGYQIQDLQAQLTSLQKQSDDLQFQSLQLQSMDRLLSQVDTSSLVQAKPDAYVPAGATAVALR